MFSYSPYPHIYTDRGRRIFGALRAKEGGQLDNLHCRALYLMHKQLTPDSYPSSEHDLGEDDIYDCVPCEDDGDDIYEDIIKVEVRQPMKMGMTEDDKRNCCLVEIQETEAKYYKTLEDIEKNYMIPLKQVLSSQEMEAIFVNLEDIIRVHFALLRAIDLNMVSGGSGLGKIFLDFKERLVSCNPHRVFDPMLLSFVLRTQNDKIQLQHKDRRLCLSF
ncbi:hypothetical protein AMECASPLE_014582 [Ameca splendens]|uniref:DH domain-containing protein n=1 Tax=Ameca splendens TaxID=208324 RepID=A0ABV0YZP7_9TELE